MSCEVTTEPLDRDDLARVAALHAVCLPRSILSALGAPVVTAYYAYAQGSADETVLIGRIDGIVQAGLLVSRAPATLLRRFALHAPRLMIGALARGLATSGELRRRCFARLRERATPEPGAPTERAASTALPEVVQIFTAPAHRGRGIGSQLLRSCEDALRRAAAPAYCIHTHADDNAAGLRFYRREGFGEVGEARSFGDRYVVMKKGLS